MTKPAPTKKSDEKKKVSAPVAKEATVSKLPAGKGSARVTKRAICIYGPGKTRKTGCLANLIKQKRVKLIAADPNCLPTLTVLGALPAASDIYEFANLSQTVEFLEKLLELADAEGAEALGIDWLIVDSLTSLFDWHKQDVARDTGQRFMGDDAKNNGWNRFNSEFGRLLDLIVAVTQYVGVIAIAHAKDREPNSEAMKKTQWAGISLSPEMSLKASRVFNWILFKTFQEVVDDGSRVFEPDDYLEKSEERGQVKWYESILHARPLGTFMASANLRPENAKKSEWPGNDLSIMLEAEGLL